MMGNSLEKQKSATDAGTDRDSGSGSSGSGDASENQANMERLQACLWETSAAQSIEPDNKNKNGCEYADLLCELVFSVPKLMNSFPPQWRFQNKITIYNTTHSAEHLSKDTPMVFRRYESKPLKKIYEIPFTSESFQVTRVREIFQYIPETDNDAGSESGPKASVWYFNFADPNLFGYYHGALFAQDELQVTEHPCLASLREYLLFRLAHSSPNTENTEAQKSAPQTQTFHETSSPCLIMNAQREVKVDAGALYGNNLRFASEEIILRSIQALTPPTFSNILAITALGIHQRGTKYTEDEIYLLFQTALSGFSAVVDTAKHSKYTAGNNTGPIVLHTGNWGCGAYGGNVIMMAVIQFISARLSGIHHLIYHTVDSSSAEQCEIAHKHYCSFWSKFAPDGAKSLSLESIVSELLQFELTWNRTNGT